MGYERAFELIQTGRIVEATEAVALGLALRIVDDPLGEARASPRRCSPRESDHAGLQQELLQASRSRSISDGFALEQQALLLNRGSAKSASEAVHARGEQRAPQFTVEPIEPLHPH